MDREVIIPEEMREIVNRAGYAPAVKVGHTIYVVGQVGRNNWKSSMILRSSSRRCGKTFVSY